ncbi:TPA: hypothetical protein ACRTTK_003154 [Aeromonas hydrophila]|uniref:hypothetical protein n=1 Tax=Aeromonas hydrophila TaxID=644 RepID=UPI0024410E4C|nr:hypothetical protein [Aeromonas hydrophila]
MSNVANSTIFKANFTDAYGVPHPEAECMITSLSRSSSAYFEQDGTASNTSSSCNYQVLFWHNKAAKEAGALPQEFVDAGRNSSFYIPETAELTMDEAIVKCQEHFVKEVVAKKQEAQQQG